MMFSSNQILEVSGDLSHLGELEDALEFALKYSGQDELLSKAKIDRGCKLVYQITKGGKYCIGWGFEEVPSGWSEYSFKLDIKIIGSIIRQHIEGFSVKEGTRKGSYYEGFIMRCPHDKDFEEIENSFYCIVYFEPYTCFYAQ